MATQRTATATLPEPAVTNLTKAALDARPTPAWYPDAKLGIFVHWGLYSIPAYAERSIGDFTSFMRDLTAMKDTGGRIPYAEWYLNAMRVPGSPTALHHAAAYGPTFSYFDFRTQFEAAAAAVDLDAWAKFFAQTHAGYVVMVTRHLDGYPLWPTEVTNPNMPREYRSKRDLVGDLTAAVRRVGLRMGLYYAGGIDWTFTDRPIRTMTDLLQDQSLGPVYARYAEAQWRELIARYQPEILWNDMGWPAEVDPQAMFADYYEANPDGLVNDRWTQTRLPSNRLARAADVEFIGLVLKVMARQGRALPTPPAKVHFDIETHEYEAPAAAIDHTWELTRGLGTSFGYNAQETAADMMTGEQLVHLLADVVSKGGNLLVNVGPDGRGQIPDIQRAPLHELGQWLDTNGEAIFGSRSWSTTSATATDGSQLRFTRKQDAVYLIVLRDRLPEDLVVPGLTLPARSPIRMLGSDVDLAWSPTDSGLRVRLAEGRSRHAHVLRLPVGATMQATGQSPM